MPLLTRDDVSTPYSNCTSCKKPTRSHVLEPAKYEQYVEEVVIDSSDEYANKQWEEVDEVTKYRKNSDAIVVCHTCWVNRLKEIQKTIKKNLQKWSEDPMGNAGKIQIIAEICHYYKFKQELKQMQLVINKLKESVTNE